MAPIELNLYEMTGKKSTVTLDSEDTILQLVNQVAEVIKVPKEYFDLIVKATGRRLSDMEGDTSIKDIYGLMEIPVLLINRRFASSMTPLASKWKLPKPNTRSLIDEKRYHTRILEEKLLKHKRNREMRALQTIAEQRDIPRNVEGLIAKFLLPKQTKKDGKKVTGSMVGGKKSKTRTLKKMRRQTRKTRG